MVKKNILFEDNHLLIINKPAGLLVQGDQTGDVTILDLVKAYIKKEKNKPGAVYLGLPHRLDRPVSGLVILCKTSKALTRMTKIFADRKIEKFYRAIVHDIPNPINGTLKNHIGQNERGKKSFVLDVPSKKSKLGELSYRVLSSKRNTSQIEINPKTGRKHQIRVQLSYAGYPIIGDLKYGSHVRLGHRICLHAHRVKFVHPVTLKDMDVSAPLPTEEEWK